jgi:hypothetical protein
MKREHKRFWLQNFGFIPCGECDKIVGFAIGVYKSAFIRCEDCEDKLDREPPPNKGLQ